MAGRFSFSAPGRRHAVDPWFRVGEFDVTTTVLVAGLSVLGIVLRAVSAETWLRFVLLPDEVKGGQVWRLVTWPLANEIATSIWPVLTIAIFWYFGRELEERLGRNRFGLFLLLLAVIPGLVATFLDISDYGLSAVQFGVFLVFVAENPYARFFFGIPAWVLALVLIAIDVLRLLSLGQSERLVVLFVSIATALITARTMGLATSVPWIPALPIGAGAGERTKRPKRGGGRRRGDVVAGPWTRADQPGGGLTSLPQPPRPGPSPADQAELDELLDKISAGGMDALSGGEKRRLNELSKRLRGSR